MQVHFKLTTKFVLRRTKDVIRGSLPPALEVVVFCRPSPQQLTLYKRCIANSSGARALLRGDGAERAAAGMRAVLPLISTLRRLCNHPDLVRGKGNARDECETETQELSEEHVAAAAEAEAEEDSDGDDVAFLLLDDDTVKTGMTCEPEYRIANDDPILLSSSSFPMCHLVLRTD